MGDIMLKKMLILSGFVFVVTAIVIVLTPHNVSATTSNEDSMGEISGNSFTAYAKWTYTSLDNIDIKLFHDGIEVAKDSGNYGYSGSGSGYVDYSPIKTGTYKVQLWSNTDNKEVYSKDWVVPNLQIGLVVSPTSGQIGTTFVATATFSMGTNAPDYYSFSGVLELDAGNSIFSQNVGGVLYSTYYYEYYKITDYTIKPVFTATGFTFPTKGEYTVGAQYSDFLTNMSATSIKVNLNDQFEPVINQLRSELNDTKSQLNKTSQDLEGTKTQLGRTSQELDSTKAYLNDTDNRLTTVKNDSNNQIQSAKLFAYIGIVIGLLGLLLGLIGIIMGRKKKVAPMITPPQMPQHYPSQQQAPQPMPHQQSYSPPPQQYSPPPTPPQQPQHQPSPQPYSPPPTQPQTPPPMPPQQLTVQPYQPPPPQYSPPPTSPQQPPQYPPPKT
jgi:hypothetical protein